jgi:hypothetical protein
LLLLVFFLVNVAYLRVKGGSDFTVPFVTYVVVFFTLLCIFRIVYIFMLPSGTLNDNLVADYALAEIPTFLLFSAMALLLGLWFSLGHQKFMFSKRVVVLIFFAIAGVAWLLYIVVLVVYATVIVDSDDGGGGSLSICVGRVGDDGNDDDDDRTRTLSIVYQSIIIALTFFMGLAFVLSTRSIAAVAQSAGRRFTGALLHVSITIVTGFFLRCIFFIIILAADFESTAYMFVVLLLTEVILIVAIVLQFQIVRAIMTGSLSSQTSSASGASRSPR